MIAVIFEVEPKAIQKNHYLKLAGELKHNLQGVSGFISIERFQSLTTDTKYLSLSFWQDENAVKTWRNNICHKNAQAKGRNTIFENYRLRVASVLRDYGMHDRSQTPDDLKEEI
ncbi:antibiotic biosynthesis monooxygenase family protein [Pseudoalteromonas denitrificans]|uniref:Heme-degrading monooxygenase HmoA n=1 Tax=Pseudoalteromonas denitrificans DSM 6059 TaxID=1123010 RepID=A0A1I1NTG1_9GAMM|nr:antibiotic biosynthesis monooxygenase [Pseudoalteromonas denitrificans]SFC98043.1 Heme-degrading monooxygenase HmoA [Pseudoalteromonas denitrificans DSM 6059]